MRKALFLALIMIVGGGRFVAAEGVQEYLLENEISSVVYVQDKAKVFSAEEFTEVEELLRTLDEELGVEVFLLTTPDTGPESISEYALRVGKDWKERSGGVDHAFMIGIAVDNQKWFVLTGNRLHEIIDEAIVERIAKAYLPSYLGEESYVAGIQAMIEDVKLFIWNDPYTVRKYATEEGQRIFWTLVFLYLLAGVWPALLGYYLSRRAQTSSFLPVAASLSLPAIFTFSYGELGYIFALFALFLYAVGFVYLLHKQPQFTHRGWTEGGRWGVIHRESRR